MVTVGQEFRNYKELCLCLKEDVKTGRSKELQLKRWQLSFSWHNEGRKIVIDEVYRDYVRQSNGGNRKHLEVFMPYVIFCLKMSGIDDEYVGLQRMMKSELKLIPSEVYDIYNHRGHDHREYLDRHGIESYESLLKFVHYFEVYAKETLDTCLKNIKAGGGIDWSPGQIFVVGMSHRKKVCTIGYEDVLDRIEEDVCNEMNSEKELKGRQYLHVVKRDPELMKEFYAECLRRLGKEKKLMQEVGKRYKEKYGSGFSPDIIIKYYRLYYIGKIDKDVLRKWRLPDKIDNIRLKKAFVNPVGQEMQMLKKKVYEDIFRRMEKNKKNKFGISDNDYEKLKELVMNFSVDRQKLTKKNYSPQADKMQGDADEDLRPEAIEN